MKQKLLLIIGLILLALDALYIWEFGWPGGAYAQVGITTDDHPCDVTAQQITALPGMKGGGAPVMDAITEVNTAGILMQDAGIQIETSFMQQLQGNLCTAQETAWETNQETATAPTDWTGSQDEQQAPGAQ